MARPRTKPHPLEAAVPGTPLDSHLAVNARLAIAMDVLGIKPADLEMVGISKSLLGNWMGCDGRPEIEAAHILCARIGFGMNYLYRGDLRDCQDAVKIAIIRGYRHLAAP